MKKTIIGLMAISVLGLMGCKKDELTPSKNPASVNSSMNKRGTEAFIRRGKLKKRASIGYKTVVVVSDNSGAESGILRLDLLEVSRGSIEGNTFFEAHEFELTDNGHKKFIFDDLDFIDLGELNYDDPIYVTASVTLILPDGSDQSELIQMMIEPAEIVQPVAKKVVFKENFNGTVEMEATVAPKSFYDTEWNSESELLIVYDEDPTLLDQAGVIPGHEYRLKFKEINANGKLVFYKADVLAEGGFELIHNLNIGNKGFEEEVNLIAYTAIKTLNADNSTGTIVVTTKEETLKTKLKKKGAAVDLKFVKLGTGGQSFIKVKLKMFEKGHELVHHQLESATLLIESYEGVAPTQTMYVISEEDFNGGNVNGVLPANSDFSSAFIKVDLSAPIEEGSENQYNCKLKLKFKDLPSDDLDCTITQTTTNLYKP